MRTVGKGRRDPEAWGKERSSYLVNRFRKKGEQVRSALEGGEASFKYRESSTVMTVSEEERIMDVTDSGSLVEEDQQQEPVTRAKGVVRDRQEAEANEQHTTVVHAHTHGTVAMLNCKEQQAQGNQHITSSAWGNSLGGTRTSEEVGNKKKSARVDLDTCRDRQETVVGVSVSSSMHQCRLLLVIQVKRMWEDYGCMTLTGIRARVI